jgi:ComF family protein
MSIRDIASLALDFLLPKTKWERDIEALSIESLAQKLQVQELWGDPRVISLFDYRDKTVKNLIWALKYKRNERAVELFALVLCDYMLEELSDMEVFRNLKRPQIIPIPLSKERRKERGFNQMELVLDALKAADRRGILVYAADILLRVKNAPSQTKLQSGEERRKNLEGAFQVKERSEVLGKDIILIDDVITTGSTILEARKMLLEAGARSVFCIGLAH